MVSGYQRSYIHAGDGGVLAIDWPSHLDLSGENGLDTTFLLIAGTSEGSGNQDIQSFVQRSVRCGYFPIVMNPRGCGGSPLITPRYGAEAFYFSCFDNCEAYMLYNQYINLTLILKKN